jgi:hypothetical protein
LNLTFLGDALDHWKGSLLESLQVARILRNLAVDPMASDLPAWKPEDFEVFARLLRINLRQIIRHEVTLKDRRKYFDEIRHADDVFLDPDIGIATGRIRQRCCYVESNEIQRLLDGFPERLIGVYQHVRGQQVRSRVNCILDSLKSKIGNFSWCSYESANVAMVFLTRKAERTSQIADHFKNLLGRHVSRRIRC